MCATRNAADETFSALRNRINFYFEERLAMTAALEIATLRLVFDDLHLVGATVFDDGAFHFGSLDNRSPDGCVRAIINEKYFVERHTIAFLKAFGELLDEDGVSLGDDILLPASLDYGHFHSGKTIAFPVQKDKAAEVSPLRPVVTASGSRRP